MIFRKKRNASSKLKHQLILQEPNTSADAVGGFTRTWDDVATLWAEITPISGSQRFAYEQQISRQRVRITLRYRSGVTTQMRLVETASNRIFDIKSVINIREEDTLIEILADVATPTN